MKNICNDSERDESTEEQLQYNEQYKCTPHRTLSPLSPAMAIRHGCALTPISIHETTETRVHA